MIYIFNPKIKDLLEADKVEYPHLYKSIKHDLANANLITDLSVLTAQTLIDYGRKAGVKFDSNNFVLNLYEIFGK
jgi:hypothetical protein